MIIVVVCDVLGNKNNGISVAAHNLINYLSQKHEVRVICPDQDKINRKNFYIVPSINFGIFNKFVKKNGVVLAKFDDLVVSKALENCDCVHIMTPFILGIKVSYICKLKNIPCTIGFHVCPEHITHIFGLNFNLINKFVFRFFYKKIYINADAIHYPNQVIRDRFEKNINKKTFGYVISNGISKKFFVNEKSSRSFFFEKKILILNTSRFISLKKQKILIKAIKYSKYKNVIQLIFLGQGPQENKLKKIAFKEKLCNYPIFDFVKNEEIINAISMCDLYVHTCDVEIESVSILEAIAGGLIPIISDSKKYGKFFALDENNLFKKDDCKDLAKKIDFWLDHRDEQKNNKEKYHEFIKKFDLESCMQKMENMLIDVVSRKNNKKN